MMPSSLERIRNGAICFFHIYLFNAKSLELPISKGSETLLIEATSRFELELRVLQTHALPLGYVAILNYSWHYFIISTNILYVKYKKFIY